MINLFCKIDSKTARFQSDADCVSDARDLLEAQRDTLKITGAVLVLVPPGKRVIEDQAA